MKLNKIFAIALAALTMTACSDDDDRKINSAEGVTVHMEETSISVLENQGIFDVPVVLEGNANGYVEVDVKVYDGTVNTDEEEPAINDAHFYVTSTKCYINPETKVGDIEVRPLDFRLPQKTRSFTITIDKVNGATVSGNASTTVYILDKGTSPEFSELLLGEWMVTGDEYNSSTGNYDEHFSYRGEPKLDTSGNLCFSIPGMFDYNFISLPVIYEYDDEIDYGDLAVRLGKDGGAMNATPIGFADPVGDAYLVLDLVSGSASTVAGTWNAKYNAVSFGDTEFIVYLYGTNWVNTGYYYSRFTNLQLTHIVR